MNLEDLLRNEDFLDMDIDLVLNKLAKIGIYFFKMRTFFTGEIMYISPLEREQIRHRP